jgi:hypothetical protein
MLTDKIAFAKFATSWIVAAGVGTIVKSIVTTATEPNEIEIDGELYTEKVKRSSKITIPVATIVVTAMAKDACAHYTDAKIDELVAFYRKYITKTDVETDPETEK